MSAGNLKVGYEALDQAAANILNKAGRVDNAINDMEKRMEGRKADWSGKDSDAFDAARLQWDKGQKQMNDNLREIAKIVNLSKEEYQAAENKNKNRFSY